MKARQDRPTAVRIARALACRRGAGRPPSAACSAPPTPRRLDGIVVKMGVGGGTLHLGVQRKDRAYPGLQRDSCRQRVRMAISCGIGRSHSFGDLRSALPLDPRDVVLALETDPEWCTIAEIKTETHRRIGGDRTAAVQNVRHAARRNADVERQPVGAQAPRRELALQPDCRDVKWESLAFIPCGSRRSRPRRRHPPGTRNRFARARSPSSPIGLLACL